MKIGEARDEVRIEVYFPHDLTQEELKELDKDIIGRMSYYAAKVEAFRAQRSMGCKREGVQPDAPLDDRDNP